MNTALLLALTMGAPALKDKRPVEPSIMGEWKVESRLDRGNPSTDRNHWVFSPDGSAAIRDPVDGSVVSHLAYTLSADGPVKAIDFLESQPNGGAELRRGIYKINGDTLTVSFTLGDTPRPTSFDPSNDCYVFVLKRLNK